MDAQCVLHILLAGCLACFFHSSKSCTECTQVVNLQNDSASKPDWRLNKRKLKKSFKKLRWMQSSWKFASKPDWRLNIWSGDQKWRNGNKHRKYLEKYLHKKLGYFCNLTLSMALYKSLAYSWTGIITSQPNPIMRKSEIWFHHKKRMEHIIIAEKDNSRRNPLVVLRHPQQKFWKYIYVSIAFWNIFLKIFLSLGLLLSLLELTLVYKVCKVLMGFWQLECSDGL